MVGLLIRRRAHGARFVLTVKAGRTRAGGAAMQELNMLYYALVFLIVGVIAGALGVAGVASVASQIAWVPYYRLSVRPSSFTHSESACRRGR